MGRWSWAAASRRGSAHAEGDERRQDAFRVTAPRGDRELVSFAACDGAGSAACGRQGAALTAWTVTECARTWLLEAARTPDLEMVAEWVQLARSRISGAAAARGLAPDDFATTLVMAISDGGSALTAHVGDGAVVGRNAESGTWLPLSWPEHGEYASTTSFITDDPGPRLRVGLHDGPIDRLAVMTDGLERVALDFASGTPHGPFFDAMLRPLATAAATGRNGPLSAALGTYLDSEQVLARTDDDKTLILAARV